MEKHEEELSFLSDQDLNDHPAFQATPQTQQTAQQRWGFEGSLGFLKKSSHPTAALFHLAFKTAALLVYIFSGFFTSNFIFVCVICILLLAFDFWTVKNVSGRLLVGLRWWNYVKEDGSNEWIFESLDNLSDINPIDKRIFWWGLYVPTALWGLIFILDVLKLNIQWLVVVTAALAMNLANIVGYTKCSNDAKQRMAKLMDQGSAGFSLMQTFSQSSAFQSAMRGLFGASDSTPQKSSSMSQGHEMQGDRTVTI